MVGPEAKLDQSPRVRNNFRLPSLAALKASQSTLGRGIPFSRGGAFEIFLPNQGLLDFADACGIHLLLAARAALAVLLGDCLLGGRRR